MHVTSLFGVFYMVAWFNHNPFFFFFLSFRLMYYSTFTARHMFMLILREEICCWVSRRAQKTRSILLTLDWLPIIHKENTSQTQRKLTMEPLNTQAEMLMLEVTAFSSITLIQSQDWGWGI